MDKMIPYIVKIKEMRPPACCSAFFKVKIYTVIQFIIYFYSNLSIKQNVS